MTHLREILRNSLSLLHRRAVAPEPVPPLLRPAEREQAATLLHIACPETSAEDARREAHVAAGQALARQERWKALSAAITAAETAGQATDSAMPVAELLAYGARADVVLAADHALLHGRPAPGAPLLDGIEALEHVLADHPGDSVIAAIVAQAHMDIAWCWRGTAPEAGTAARNRAAFAAHFDRAADILAPFQEAAMRSPLVAATRCALLGAAGADARAIADGYAALTLLNPANPRPLRAMGNHLLPRWYGSYDALELEARRTCARLLDTWGSGGYTWVMFDAISHDDQACANLDLPFFAEGLRDILARVTDPYTVNLLAAYCANATSGTQEGCARAQHHRTQIASFARWIVRDHLTEIHPLIWAHAAQGFDNNLRIRSARRFAAAGRADAIRLITRLFDPEIAAGQRVVFTDTPPLTS